MFGKFINNFRNQFLQQTKSVDNGNHCKQKKGQKNDCEKSWLNQNEADSFTCNSGKGKSRFEQMWEEAQNKTHGRRRHHWFRPSGGQVHIHNDEPQPREMYGIVKPTEPEEPTEPSVVKMYGILEPEEPEVKPTEPTAKVMYGIIEPEEPAINPEPTAKVMYGIIEPEEPTDPTIEIVPNPALEPGPVVMYGIIEPQPQPDPKPESPIQEMLNNIVEKLKSIIDIIKQILNKM